MKSKLFIRFLVSALVLITLMQSAGYSFNSAGCIQEEMTESEDIPTEEELEEELRSETDFFNDTNLIFYLCSYNTADFYYKAIYDSVFHSKPVIPPDVLI